MSHQAMKKHGSLKSILFKRKSSIWKDTILFGASDMISLPKWQSSQGACGGWVEEWMGGAQGIFRVAKLFCKIL